MTTRTSTRQIESIEVARRLADRQLQTVAHQRAFLLEEINAVEDRVALVKAEISSQFETPNPQFAPLLGVYVQSARAEIRRLQAKSASLQLEAECLEAQVTSCFNKARTLELTEATLRQRQKQEAKRVAEARATEDILYRYRAVSGRRQS